MLQKIIPFIFLMTFGFERTALAVLFSAPGADLKGFQKASVQKNQQTYTQWLLENRSQSDVEAHPQVLDFSERALQSGSTKQIMNEWEVLRQSLQLNSADREILFLLAEKLKLTAEVCRYALLEPKLAEILENPALVNGCEQKGQMLSLVFLQKLKSDDLLMIEGKVFSKEQIPAKLVPGTYQWKVISNTYEDYSFQSTLGDLAKQSLSLQPWVQGTCENYKLNYKEFSVLVQSQIYFSDSCVPAGIPPEKNLKTWAKEHKTLLWGIGIIAAGFAAYQLRDKTLVVTTP